MRISGYCTECKRLDGVVRDFKEGEIVALLQYCEWCHPEFFVKEAVAN